MALQEPIKVLPLRYWEMNWDQKYTASICQNVVSKYIGETEKNLDHCLAQAEDKGWILFFDEADALFGKRTESTNESDTICQPGSELSIAKDRRIWGLVILSSNSKDNIDNAFIRRFHYVIIFRSLCNN